MTPLIAIIITAGAVIVTSGFTLLLMHRLYKIKEKKFHENIRRKEATVMNDARLRARTITKEARLHAKEMAIKMKNAIEKTMEETRKELISLEKHVAHREQSLEKKDELVLIRENKAKERENQILEEERRIDKIRENTLAIQNDMQHKLEQISKLTINEAKEQLKENLRDEVNREMAKEIRRRTEEVNEDAEFQSRRIISIAIGRYSGDVSSEKLIYVYHLPSDDLKGKIIGREGRNIRTIESSCGVDLIVDDTPETVTISSFDPVRREVARQVIEALIQDGRIHPARIEETAHKVTKQVNQQMREAGKQAAFELGVHNLHPELIKTLGSLKYRTSYQQNQLLHSIEVGHLAGTMAAEIGANIHIAKRAGLLHDVGKALSHTIEGAHAVVGGDFAKRYGESPEVVHAIRAHHQDVALESVEAHLIQASDALSGARPGARRESMERYVKRIEDIERVAKSFEGVEKVYAIQAGREIRVIVDNQKISDEDSVMLSREISKKIESELNYPGQVKVVVIRETRSVSVAK